MPSLGLVAPVAAALLLAGCGWLIGTPAPQGSDALVSVAITGDLPPDELSLEIDRAAWTVSGGGGIASLSSGLPPTVRLARVVDCEVLAEFDADPGTAYVIRFVADGTVEVDEWTDALDAGPALARRDAPASCA